MADRTNSVGGAYSVVEADISGGAGTSYAPASALYNASGAISTANPLPSSSSIQQDWQATLQSAATAAGNGTAAVTAGVNGAISIEIVNTDTAAATIALEASREGTRWYTVGYYQIDGNASLSRLVANISIANTNHVYQVLDYYRQLRARVVSFTPGSGGTVSAYAFGVAS